MSNLKTSTITSFNAPGFPDVDDKLTQAQKTGWSKQISDWMDNEINAGSFDEKGNWVPLLGPKGPRTKLEQFFNGTVTPFDVSQKPTAITWIGFPRLIQQNFPEDRDRWNEADDHRDQQDEYLEWTVNRDDDEVIRYVTFTCEGPEYWAFLAQNDRAKALQLYQSLNPEFAQKMKVEDLFDSDGTTYEPYNQWNGLVKSGDSYIAKNPGCIMHLAQVNNTLSAEIDIAAQGTVIRQRQDGTIITNRVELCNCSAYGNASRNSDPQIGSSINTLARNGAKVSIADPVAIYMQSFNTSNFMLDPDGTRENLQPIPDGTFSWVRGNINKNKGLRLHVQIPDGVLGSGAKKGVQLRVGDIVDTSNNSRIQFGAQFADYIRMGVNGIVISGGSAAKPENCPGRATQPTNGHSVNLSSLSTAMHTNGTNGTKAPRIHNRR